MQTCCAQLTQNDSDEIAAGAQTRRATPRVLLERSTAIARKSALNSAGAVRLAAQQGRQHTLDSTTKRRARSMDDRLECDSGLSGTSARASPCIILSARCGQHVGVAKAIVNNNPETMKVPRRSFRTAAGWCFAPAPHAEEHRSANGSIDAPTASAALRCVSKHEGEPNRTSSSFETRARAFDSAEALAHARSSG